MNQRIDFSKLGGFPATQYTFDYMQASYRNAFTALALMIGDKVIVSGIDLVGGQYTDGWISIAGELIPFIGGAAQGEFFIEESTEPRLFQSGQTNTVYFKRVARFGGPGIPFNQLRRLGELMASIQTLNNYVSNFNTHLNNNNNPHGVDKSQVGLGNIPNATSNNPYLNDANVLATTAATAALAGKIIYVGTHLIGDIGWDDLWTVNHNQNISGGYIVVGNLVSYGDWGGDNDAICVIVNKQANSFQLATRQMSGTEQQIQFEYVLIRI